MIKYEQEVINLLGIPNVPKKEWDGLTSFKKGVAILEMQHGDECYAIASYDDSKETKPRVVKVFDNEPFVNIKNIFVVPEYMTTIEEIEDFDVDEKSKETALNVLKEAKSAERNDDGDDEFMMNTKNEYFFDFITNDDEAKAFIASYNTKNKIKGRVPTTHDGIITRLSVIFHDGAKKNNKKQK